LGEQGYTCINDIPEHIKIDVADFFLRSEKVLPLVEEALQRGIKTIWLQQGVMNEEAAKLCTECGAGIIMDKCIKMEHIKSKYQN
jgi:predicted CoA-binding protein